MDSPLVTDAEQGGRDRAVALLSHPRWAELTADRRRFFGYAWTLFLGAAVLLFGLAAFVPKALAHVLVPGLSVGIVAGFGYVVLIFVLTVQYARRARRWDALIAELRAVAGYPEEGRD